MGSNFATDADPEHARLAVLHGYRIVDTPPESQFDEIVRRAAAECNTPVAGLVLVDERRCWFKAKVGVEMTEVDRNFSFSNHAFRSRGIFVVTDARQDSRFNQLPVVTKEGFVFFAGVPLVTPFGYSIGTLCVLDRSPRELSAPQIAGLKMLASQVMDRFEQRRKETESSSVTTPQSAAKTEVKSDPGSLLIVDDDDAVRSFVCVASRRLGYQVLEAANGIEALKQVENNPGKITLVLTDVNMPLMDGLELVRSLKKHLTPPAIAVMSGRFDPYIRSSLHSEGITALMGKPFSTEELKLTLLRALAAAAA